MDAWKQELQASESAAAELAAAFGLDPEQTAEITESYPARITPYLRRLLTTAAEPLRRQFLPDGAELSPDSLPEDPLDEKRLAPVPAVVHRYPSRALLLAANSCAAYCRFCTRKRQVGKRDKNLTFGEVLDGIAYIAGQPEINEVIISGGDPLTLADSLLKEILQRLQQVEHVTLLRIATRIPAIMPERITPQLVELLGRFQPLYLTTHFNHPDELTDEARHACQLLSEAGVPLANQSVLLKGVNDDLPTLSTLFTQLLHCRVRPYYLHQMDPVHGTGHFRVPVEHGLRLMADLRRTVSGLAMPHYVIDAPGGLGKIALTPDSILSLGPIVRLRTATGQTVDYPNAQ
jgi:lysine 2,3-aminomutase